MINAIIGKLVRMDDPSREAAQLRLAASIEAIGMTKTEFGLQIGQKVAAITNATTGNNHPSREAMHYLWKHHDIDPAFIMFGAFRHVGTDLRSNRENTQ